MAFLFITKFFPSNLAQGGFFFLLSFFDSQIPLIALQLLRLKTQVHSDLARLLIFSFLADDPAFHPWENVFICRSNSFYHIYLKIGAFSKTVFNVNSEGIVLLLKGSNTFIQFNVQRCNRKTFYLMQKFNKWKWWNWNNLTVRVWKSTDEIKKWIQKPLIGLHFASCRLYFIANQNLSLFIFCIATVNELHLWFCFVFFSSNIARSKLIASYLF